MKTGKSILLALFFLLALTGCQKEEEGKEEFISKTREGYCLHTVDSGSSSLFWEGETRFYMAGVPLRLYGVDANKPAMTVEEMEDRGGGFIYNKTGSYLYYCEKEGMEGWKPLCEKPGCRHQDWNCNSYLGPWSVSVGFYDNHIYYMSFDYSGENEMGIYRMDLNGGEKEEVKKLPYHNGWKTGGLYHNGQYFYYQYELKENGIAEELYVCSLEEGGEPELILEEESDTLLAYRMYPLGDKVYIQRQGEDVWKLFCYEIGDGKLTTLSEDCPKGYFYPMEEEMMTISEEEGAVIWKYDGEEKREVYRPQEESGLYYDGDYFYECLPLWRENELKDELRILNPDGTECQTLTYHVRDIYEEMEYSREDWEEGSKSGADERLPTYYETLYYYGSTEDYVFFSFERPGYIPSYYLEKEKIGTDELEWKPLSAEHKSAFNEDFMRGYIEYLKGNSK